MTDKLSRGVDAAAKRIARAALGAVSPPLLQKIQVARAHARYQREPVTGPKRLLLEVTTACNYRCLMCTDHGPLIPESTPAKVMPWDTVERLLRDAAAMGAEQAWFAGRGEPLLYPEAVAMVSLAPPWASKPRSPRTGASSPRPSLRSCARPASP